MIIFSLFSLFFKLVIIETRKEYYYGKIHFLIMPYFSNHEGVDIFYMDLNEKNKKFPIILLHGYGSSSTVFKRQISFLNEYFRLILIDIQGHGKSFKGENPFEMNLLSKTICDIIDLFDLLKINSEFGIISHGIFGSNIALELAKQKPMNAEFIIILNGGNLILDNPIKNMFWNLLPQITKIHFNEIMLESFDRLLEKTLPYIKESLIKQRNEYMRNMSNNSNSSNLVINPGMKKDGLMNSSADLEIIIKNNLDALLENTIQSIKLKAAVLIIAAELDEYAPVSISKVLTGILPNSELRIVTMAGHYGLQQRYNEYNRIILEFLEKRGFILDE